MSDPEIDALSDRLDRLAERADKLAEQEPAPHPAGSDAAIFEEAARASIPIPEAEAEGRLRASIDRHRTGAGN